MRILFPNTPEKRKIIVHTIRKRPIRTTVIQLSSTGIFDNNAIHANSFVNANGRSIRTYFQTVVICGEPIPLCVYTSGIHTHKQVSSCKTSETRLSFFLLQFRHVDLHGHANSIRHETPRGNGLGASGSRHKVTTDRFLVDYFKSKLRRSLIPRDVWETALLFRRLTFFSRNTEFPVTFARVYPLDRGARNLHRAVFRPETRRAQFCHHVFPGMVTIGASSSA